MKSKNNHENNIFKAKHPRFRGQPENFATAHINYKPVIIVLSTTIRLYQISVSVPGGLKELSKSGIRPDS